MSTIREDREAAGAQAPLSFADWLAALNELAGDRYGSGKTSDITGEDCWRDFYDDDYSPQEALDEDDSQQ